MLKFDRYPTIYTSTLQYQLQPQDTIHKYGPITDTMDIVKTHKKRKTHEHTRKIPHAQIIQKQNTLFFFFDIQVYFAISSDTFSKIVAWGEALSRASP
jgi:hypothetical protein